MNGRRPATTADPNQVIELAARHRLPAIYPINSLVSADGLVFYGYSSAWFMTNAAMFVDRILKGRKPAELPVQQPTHYEMILNFRTAKALGLTVPESILVFANEVIK